jgi:transposase
MDTDTPWREKRLIMLFYHGCDLSLADTAEILDCSVSTLRKWMDRLDVERRPQGPTLTSANQHTTSDDDTPWRDKNLLMLFYHGLGLSTRGVGYILDCSKHSVARWLKNHDIPLDDSNRDKPPYIDEDSDGYMTCMHYDGEEYQRFYLHRLLAVAEHGFDALNGKVVHHTTGHKLDNRRENLELLSKQKHHERHFGFDPEYQKGLP